MRVLDPGHTYELATLDGGGPQIKRFVKRIGQKYPGNVGPGYGGTILQEQWRADIDRLRYVNGQFPCAETEAAIGLIEGAILLLEIRAKRTKHKILTALTVGEVVNGQCCAQCGHVKCTEHGDAT